MEIYLHVPYCRQKCRYCDFASFPHAESTQRAYVDAVLTEAGADRSFARVHLYADMNGDVGI